MHEYISIDGIPIRVGKNARENDTMPREPKEWWLHVADSPGSHVIIGCDKDHVPKETRTDAAVLAVYHSKALPKKMTSVHLVRAEQVVPQKHAGQVILEGAVIYLSVFMNKENHRLERLLNKNSSIK
jgi:predicted ribosome quality control (RQC) complex YloA/Tae2 family protein